MSILTNILDESPLSYSTLIDRGYKCMSFSDRDIYRKRIFHYTDIIDCNNSVKPRVGVRSAYLHIHKYHSLTNFANFGKYLCRLEYVLPSQERRTINATYVKDLFELSGIEAWAYTMVRQINDDRINGTFSWPKYEYK